MYLAVVSSQSPGIVSHKQNFKRIIIFILLFFATPKQHHGENNGLLINSKRENLGKQLFYGTKKNLKT